MNLHIDLHIEGVRFGATLPVEVKDLGAGRYKILFSPGLIEGIAAGDIIFLSDPRSGTFCVMERGGNIAIKLTAGSEIGGVFGEAIVLMQSLGARLDGVISKAAVWTVSASVGFEAIEATMQQVIQLIPDSEWRYGNVYDEYGEPLNWW